MFQLGNVCGVVGMVICAVAGIGRFIGDSTFLGFQAINFFILGMALLLVGIFAKVSGK